MALKCHNIEPIFYSTPNIPQHPVCDLTTGLHCESEWISQSFPDFAVCDLGPGTVQRASGHSICWTWSGTDENQHSFIVPLSSPSDWTKLLGIFFSPLAQPNLDNLCHLQMLLPHLFSRSWRDTANATCCFIQFIGILIWDLKTYKCKKAFQL